METVALSSSFHVRYEGDSIQAGRIDARALADSLLAITDTLERSNKIINGKNSEVMVKIDANMLPGSFVVKLLAEIGAVGTEPTVAGIASVVTIVGFAGGLLYQGCRTLIGFMKKAKNRKIVSIETTENDLKSVTFSDGEGIDKVSQEVIDLYENLSVRLAIENMSQVLNTDGVASMSFWDDENDRNPEVIEKGDRPLLKAPESGVLLDRDEETILVISVANLSGEPGGWKFKEDEISSDFSADVFDSTFLDKIKNRKISLKCGDMVKVILKKQQSRPRRNLKTSYSILRVIEFIPYDSD